MQYHFATSSMMMLRIVIKNLHNQFLNCKFEFTMFLLFFYCIPSQIDTEVRLLDKYIYIKSTTNVSLSRAAVSIFWLRKHLKWRITWVWRVCTHCAKWNVWSLFPSIPVQHPVSCDVSIMYTNCIASPFWHVRITQVQRKLPVCCSQHMCPPPKCLLCLLHALFSMSKEIRRVENLSTWIHFVPFMFHNNTINGFASRD